MKRFANDMIPGEVFHPSGFIKEEMEAQGKIQADLVRASGVGRSYISQFFKGKKSINIKLALALEAVLDIPAEFWIRKQRSYDLYRELIELRKIKQAS